METLTTTIEWHLAEKELPEKSGEYLTVTDSGTISDVSFSKKHNLFNTYDWKDNPGRDYDVVFWAEIPECFSWKSLAPYRRDE